MLEVKNLKKEYRTKKGAVTKALDDVSLTFPETGMIFILGKSGSGKSTLLNVCGGLDRMDDGEIIIKGKSSKDFSAQDFDSYRNTYVGFVFQEYNILDEFTVEQNIALALELQNKKPDKEVISKLLEDVDLTDFASRKPNTLSGGQKQRVAIARALVKEPQIIMADEPTGALDSKTGQQVFDTLKKLSKEKLVLIVSHDRDFAEQYGDRIIELKDGKVISDQTRAEVEGVQNVKFYGTDTVCVTKGNELTEADMQSIKNFLARSGGTAVISTSREKIAQFREDRPEISVGTFENIKEQPVSKEYEKQKLIRSHMPLKHAIKMGGSSLKTKPVRLVFTIFLSVIAFVLFGLASTLMLFDGHEVTVQSFADSNINYISLGKSYYVTYHYDGGDTNTQPYDTKFTKKEYEELAQKYNNAIPTVMYEAGISNLRVSSAASDFYSERIESVIPASDKLTLVAGNMPEKDDEVAITEFIYDAIRSNGSVFNYGEDNTALEVTSYDSLLYSTDHPVLVTINNDKNFKIVGIFKGMNVPNDYKSLKEAADRGERAESTFASMTWREERRYGMYMTVALTQKMFDSIAASNTGGAYVDYEHIYFKGSQEAQIRINANVQSEYKEHWFNTYSRFNKYEGNTLDIYGLNGKQIKSVGDGEIVLQRGRLIDYYRYVLETIDDQVYNRQFYYSARYEYEENHPYPNENDFYGTVFDNETYWTDRNNWEGNRSAYISQLNEQGIYDEEFESKMQEWLLQNPEPQDTDAKYQVPGIVWEDYYAATSKYEEEREAYAIAKEQEATTAAHTKYKAIADALMTQAQTDYLANNPEPKEADYDSYGEWRVAHELWENKLRNTIEYARPGKSFNRIYNSGEDGPISQEEIAKIIASAANVIDEIGANVTFTISSDGTNQKTVKVVGYFTQDASNCCYMGADVYAEFYHKTGYDYTMSTKYTQPKDAVIDAVLIPYDGSRGVIEELLNVSDERQSDDSAVQIKNAIKGQLDMVINTADMLELGFIIAGAVLALFAFLLMFNFISASITAKKKDIGILRAIGARTVDVFKIFVSEAMIIALICFAISTIGTLGLCMLLNSIILEDVGVTMTLFVFGPISVLAILGIAVVTALISTLIPVGLYSRKPPIASIRAL